MLVDLVAEMRGLFDFENMNTDVWVNLIAE